MTSTAPAGEFTPGLRRFLLLTSAVNGAAIMIIEILGAKMLSPYFGTSHFVWTAQIAITLLALALGYWAGGWLVDRKPTPAKLYLGMIVAAVWLGLSVVFCRNIAFGSLSVGSLAVGSLLASAVLYLVPLSLLAMTGPVLVRVLTSNVASVGGRVGSLSALSTVGSVLGTILIGYVLVPLLPNSRTMYLTAGLLVALAGVYFLLFHRRAIAAAPVALVLVGLAAAASERLMQVDREKYGEIHAANSDFGELQVIEFPANGITNRWYLNDLLTQNTYDPATGQSTSMFTYMLHGLAHAYVTNVQNVLCIGVGVGIVPMEFAKEKLRVDAVEINEAVIDVAEKYFGFDRRALNLLIADGREFLHRTTNRYDAVVLDAFLGDSCPSHLMTREAFESIRSVMAPGGVLVINTFASYRAGRDFFGTSLERTLRSVFDSVVIHADGGGNLFYVACPESGRKLVREPSSDHVHALARGRVRATYSSIQEPVTDRGIILTDDFNPVEFHDAENREATRRNLIGNLRYVAGQVGAGE